MWSRRHLPVGTDGYTLLWTKDSTRMNDTNSTTSGRRVVGWIFVMALTIGVGFGYFVGAVISNDAAVSVGVLFLTFRPTPLNMAAYGGLAVVVLSAMFYAAVRLTARFDDGAESAR